MINVDALVVENILYTPKCHRLRLAVPYSGPVAAGQFVHVRCDDVHDPLLRRPFSIYDIRTFDDAWTNVDILFTVVGKGTALLARKKPLDRVGFLGPLGVGYTCDPDLEVALFVAGGVGIVPFYPLARQFQKEHPRTRLILLFGARTAEDLYGLRDFEALDIEIGLATEDGSLGIRGYVTRLLEDALADVRSTPGLRRKIYACGPEPMLDRVARIARQESVPCEISMEKRMGCALGACGACVTKVFTDDRADFRYSRICIEGPTYDARNLYLD